MNNIQKLLKHGIKITEEYEFIFQVELDFYKSEYEKLTDPIEKYEYCKNAYHEMLTARELIEGYIKSLECEYYDIPVSDVDQKKLDNWEEIQETICSITHIWVDIVAMESVALIKYVTKISYALAKMGPEPTVQYQNQTDSSFDYKNINFKISDSMLNNFKIL